MAAGSSNPTTNVVKVAGTAVDTNTGNASAGTQRVVLASNQPTIAVSLASVPTHAVTGTFWQATQPVSGAFYQATQPVSGTFWQTTQPVSLVTLPAGTNAIGSITNTSFAATQSGTWNIATLTNLSQLGGTAISMNTGVRDAGTQRVTIATNDSLPVTGTFFQTTQPVSGPVTDAQLRAAAVPITGTVTNLSQLGGTAISMNTGVRDAGTQRVTIATNDAVPVTGTFYQTTQPVSATALPLPTGAATAAKQPALGIAGTASADVITVQGIANGVAQPISGSVTVTQATAANLNATVTGTVELGATSLAALENINVTIPGTVDLGTISLTALETITVTSGTPGNFQSRGYGAVTTAAPAYTTGTDNALSLTTSGALRVDNSAVTQPVSGTFWQATQPVSGPLTDAQLRATAVPVSLASVPTHGVTGTFWQTTQPVSGTFWQTTQPVSGPLTDAQLRAAAVPITGTVTNLSQLGGTAISMNTGVRDAGTQRVTIATNDSVPVTGTFYQATQPVSGPLTDAQLRAAAVPITGTVTSLTQMNGQAISMNTGVRDAGTQRVTIATNDSLPVTGPLTDAQLRATAVPVSQSGTWTVQPGNTANTTPWLIKPLESLGTATALGALNAEIAQALNGNLGAAVVITATAAPVGVTLTPYASYDGGTNWTVTQFFNSANGDAISTLTAFAAGDSYSLSAGDGATHVKVRATGWTSGSVTVRLSASNSQGLVNLKSTAVHDDAAGSFIQQMGAVASSTAPTAVSANGDAVRLWATTSGALNIADGGGSITVDGTFYQATQPVSLVSVPTHGVTGTFWQTTQPVSVATLPALAAGTNVIGTVNLAGATTNALTNTTTTAYAASLIVKASAGTIYTLNGYNSKTSGQFIQLHNSATLPADAAVPVVTFYVPASSNFSFDWGVYGRAFSLGIVVTTSSTGPTKTIGAADCWFDATSK